MPARFLVFPNIHANSGQVIIEFPGVFIADPADFVYNRVVHRSASSNSSGEHIFGSGDTESATLPNPSFAFLAFFRG